MRAIGYKISLILVLIILGLAFSPKLANHYQRAQQSKENQSIVLDIQSESVVDKSLGILRNDTESLIELGKLRDLNPGNKYKIPEKIHLDVPFYCQAPLETAENWELHEESCEEAATLQAISYLRQKVYSKEEANEIILDMIAWQEENFGGHYDLYAQQMKQFIVGYYDLPEHRVIIKKNADLQDIKEEVSKGYPVIVPITGEILKNPHYPYPGYHMLTVIGYNETHIITNDNGTMHGKNFSYKNDVFERAYKDAAGDILIIKISKD